MVLGGWLEVQVEGKNWWQKCRAKASDVHIVFFIDPGDFSSEIFDRHDDTKFAAVSSFFLFAFKKKKKKLFNLFRCVSPIISLLLLDGTIGCV